MLFSFFGFDCRLNLPDRYQTKVLLLVPDPVQDLMKPVMCTYLQRLLTDKNIVHAGTITEIKKKCVKTDTGLILLHRSMVTTDIMADIRQAAPGFKIFLLSDRPDEEEGFTFLKQGIVGYANTYISPTKASHHKLESLTPREHEIADMVAQGQSNLEIACNLNIAERTVKAHLSSIYAKTGTGNRLNLALLLNQGNKG